MPFANACGIPAALASFLVLAVASAGCIVGPTHFEDVLTGGSGFSTTVWMNSSILGDQAPLTMAMAANESLFAVLAENGSIILADRAGAVLAPWSWSSSPGYSSPGTPPEDYGCPRERTITFVSEQLLVSCERFLRAYNLDGALAWASERTDSIVSFASMGATGGIVIGSSKPGAEIFTNASNESIPLLVRADVITGVASAGDGSIVAVTGRGDDLGSGSTCFFDAEGRGQGCVAATGSVSISRNGSRAVIGPSDVFNRSVATVDLRSPPLVAMTSELRNWKPGLRVLDTPPPTLFVSSDASTFGLPSCIILEAFRSGDTHGSAGCVRATSIYRSDHMQGDLGFTTSGDLFVAGFCRDDGGAVGFSYDGGFSEERGVFFSEIYMTIAVPGATLPTPERHWL